jgi:hypothetical protein
MRENEDAAFNLEALSYIANKISYEIIDEDPETDEKDGLGLLEVSDRIDQVIVTYLGVIIWCSENDEREQAEDGTPEDIEGYLRRKVNRLNERIMNIRV